MENIFFLIWKINWDKNLLILFDNVCKMIHILSTGDDSDCDVEKGVIPLVNIEKK
jgi:hypothetical protein